MGYWSVCFSWVSLIWFRFIGCCFVYCFVCLLMIDCLFCCGFMALILWLFGSCGFVDLLLV